MTGADARRGRRERRIVWATRLGGVAIRALATTWRIRVVNRAASDRLRCAKDPVIFTLWHGEMLPLLWQHRHEGIAVLISEHGDGEIIARVAESLGFRTVRGSTSRGADRALLGMSRAVESGSDLAFTPDGPRGPAESFAPGALVVAQRSGAPIVTVRVSAPRSWRLRSWDRFMIPKPFARVMIAYGDPVYVSAASVRDAASEADRFEALMRDTGVAAGE
jgi:lysophospholipid acyltransferase (LPLAT)-like uncharacterized protein